MQIVIDIPEEFEEHFNQDRFDDSLHRLSADAHLLAGRYEQETASMLINAFKNSTPLPKGHGRIIDESKVTRTFTWDNGYIECYAPTIILSDMEGDNGISN